MIYQINILKGTMLFFPETRPLLNYPRVPLEFFLRDSTKASNRIVRVGSSISLLHIFKVVSFYFFCFVLIEERLLWGLSVLFFLIYSGTTFFFPDLRKTKQFIASSPLFLCFVLDFYLI